MSLTICGPQASTYETTIRALDRGEPDHGWSTVASSVNARVSYSTTLSAYLKVFLARNKLEGLKAILRGSRCQRARQNGELLSEAGFNTPRCHCWGTLNNGQEFMITEASAGMGVTHYIREKLNLEKNAASFKHKRRFLAELGVVIGQLHLAGIVHGDLRTSNILIELNAGQHSFCFIDNERNSSHRTIPLKLIKKNLIQLNMLLPTDINRGDRWHFCKAYNATYPRFSQAEIRQLAREVYLAAMARLQKKGKL